MDKILAQLFFLQRGHTDSLQAHKMFKLTYYQRNANQIHNEISPNAPQNDLFKKRIKAINVKDMEKMKHICTVDGNINWFIFLANGIEIPFLKCERKSNFYIIQQCHF